VDVSSSLCEAEDDSMLLNQNVSFSSTLLTSMDVNELPKLSVTLTETELQKLRMHQKEDNNVSMEMSLAEDTLLALDGDPVSTELAATSLERSDCFHSQIVEVGRRLWSSTPSTQHYTKGCSWSPDGTCLLVPVHLDGMHVLEMPADLYTATSLEDSREISSLQSAVHVPEGGTVYDCVWYPLMNSQQPDTCFWLATRQHEPIHMWDAFDGKLRCSYSGYDAVDEVMAAISLAFSQDGQKIFAGYKRCIKIFDLSRPGRICDDFPVKFAISCIAQTGEHPNALTCGNWHGYIQHFDLRSNPKDGPLFTLGEHKAGITQLRYGEATAGAWNLFSGARKCPKLLQWDMRNYKAPLREFRRQVDTNQRIQFDVTADLGWLASGDTRGQLNLWDLSGEREAAELPLHGDCCNGVSLNPVLPIMATTSGQFHFSEGDNDNEAAVKGGAEEAEKAKPLEVVYENGVFMWWIGRGA
ncbi:hypothetical protein KR018_004391, partial [Drosophila ironensis]